jgi:hypothetical protein
VWRNAGKCSSLWPSLILIKTQLTMKKLLLTLLIASVVSFSTQAQMQVGVKAGINLATQSSDVDGFEAGSALGLIFGVPVRLMLNDNLAFQPEVSFMQKGSSSDYSFEVPGFYTLESSGKGIINYVEIPLMFQYLFGGGDIMPFVTAGPSIGLGLGYKSSGTSTTTTTDPFTGVESSITDDYDDSGSMEDAGLSAIDFGVGFGAGAVMAAGNGSLIFQIGYLLGLANIYDDTDFGKLNNRGVNITVGYLINLN